MKGANTDFKITLMVFLEKNHSGQSGHYGPKNDLPS